VVQKLDIAVKFAYDTFEKNLSSLNNFFNLLGKRKVAYNNRIKVS